MSNEEGPRRPSSATSTDVRDISACQRQAAETPLQLRHGKFTDVNMKDVRLVFLPYKCSFKMEMSEWCLYQQDVKIYE